MNVPRNDDERFESFLRQFRPRAPRPLRIEEPPARREYAFGLLTATAAVALVAGILVISSRPTRTSPSDGVQTVGSVRPGPEPLTLGRANALLLGSPSISAAVDSLAVESETPQVPKGMRSALATLADENFKEKRKL